LASNTNYSSISYLSIGKYKPNDWIEISKKTTTFVYDEKAVLESLKAENQTQFIRVKEEINKIELNKALRNNELPWLDVQRVEDVTVSIRPPSEVLVQVEARS